MRDPSSPSPLRHTALLLLFGLLVWGCEAPPADSGDAEAAGAQPADEAETSDAAQDAAPDPEAAIIRLDPNDPNLEVWRDRDISDDPPREPGPIRVGSVLTFFGLPVAREVEVAFMGAPVDMGVGFRGAGGSTEARIPAGNHLKSYRTA